MKKLRYDLTIFLILLLGLALWQIATVHPHTINIKKDFAAFQPQQNTAIYAAYSADHTVPNYVITYLRALKEIAPNIIYITDNPIRKNEIKKLAPFITRIEALHHGEYDWGSYKRGVNWLQKNNYLSQTDKLILANDSTLLVAPSLTPIMEAIPDQADFYGITANQDGLYHLQSYFLVFKPQVYQKNEFLAYLNNVTAQKDGLTVAYRYEVPFTQYLENLGFHSASYIPYEKLSFLPLNDKNCYPLTMLATYHTPLLKLRTFTQRLNIQEPKRLVLEWLKKNAPQAYADLHQHFSSAILQK